MKAKDKANIVRQLHERCGGFMSTTELAKDLQCSERTIRAYLLNECVVDTSYKPKSGRKTTDHNLVVTLYANGKTQREIANSLGVSQPYISTLLKKVKTNEQSS